MANFTIAKNTPVLLVLLDFEKAFDNVEWAFIKKHLNCSVLVPLL